MRDAAVVLLSGGLDSACTLVEAMCDGRTVYPLAFNYGQRNIHELQAARKQVARYRKQPENGIAPLEVFTIVANFGAAAALDQDRKPEDIGNTPSAAYVPCRNAIFFSMAAAYAEALNADEVWAGLNFNDSRGYPMPDGRMEFVRTLELALTFGSRRGMEGKPVRLITPLIAMSKTEIVQRSVAIGVSLKLTRSCYADTEEPCRRCDACIVRAAAFAEAGLHDPAIGLRNAR